mmetsp:Transcript_11317/g.45982  ORF Transcript_11317/g.45982 Transcript_11317/m.45982 type:complete len:208 (-) Transcript_11317:384-1007(-)
MNEREERRVTPAHLHIHFVDLRSVPLQPRSQAHQLVVRGFRRPSSRRRCCPKLNHSTVRVLSNRPEHWARPSARCLPVVLAMGRVHLRPGRHHPRLLHLPLVACPEATNIPHLVAPQRRVLPELRVETRQLAENHLRLVEREAVRLPRHHSPGQRLVAPRHVLHHHSKVNVKGIGVVEVDTRKLDPAHALGDPVVEVALDLVRLDIV